MAAQARRQQPPLQPQPPEKQQQQKLASFATVQGMDTREERSGIANGFWSWLFNVQPIGNRTLRILNGKGSTLYTAPSMDTILWYGACVIGSSFYLIVFLASGKADQVAISGGAVTHISATAGTFWTSGSYPHFTAFGNSGILIVSPLGYWAWDGTTLYAAGSEAPSWLTGTSQSVTLTGTATNGSNGVSNVSSTSALAVGMAVDLSGFAAPSYISAITGATSFNVGHNGGASDFSGATGSYSFTFSALDVVGQATMGDNTVTLNSVTDLVIGLAVYPVSGGFSSGTTITSIVSSTEIAMSNNYTNSSGYVELDFAWPMPTGISGTAIEIYNASPWILDGRTVLASAPGNGADFATTDGAVSLTVQDAYVQSGYTGLKQLDGFLYLLAPSACDVISDVQTNGTPPTTTFLRVNVSELIGSPWRDTICALPSSIAFANPAGVYEVAGGQARKVSDYFDGIFENATFPTNPCGCIATLSEITCYGVTLNIADPDTGITSNDVGFWDGRRWFLASQETEPIIVATQSDESQQTAWGSDGNTIFQMFAEPSSTLVKKVKSWFFAGDSGINWWKEVQRVYAQFGNVVATSAIFTEFNIDTENGSFPADQPDAGLVTWLNNNGGTVTWLNNSSDIVTWQTNVFPLVIGAGAAVIGLILGITAQTVVETLDIVGLYLGYLDYSEYY